MRDDYAKMACAEFTRGNMDTNELKGGFNYELEKKNSKGH